MTAVPEPPDPSSLPESLRMLQLLWRLNAALERTSTDMESTLGVTGPERFLLRFIGLAPGLTPGALAEVMSIALPDVTQELERLVAKNLLIAQEATCGYYLTASGARVNAMMTGTVEEAVSKAADEASTYERTSFRRMLERIVERLHQS